MYIIKEKKTTPGRVRTEEKNIISFFKDEKKTHEFPSLSQKDKINKKKKNHFKAQLEKFQRRFQMTLRYESHFNDLTNILKTNGV